jgi:tetratricopeptide (TPR) repeat protein
LDTRVDRRSFTVKRLLDPRFVIAAAMGAALLAGCGGGQLSDSEAEKGEAAMPEGHPPVQQGALGSAGPTDDNPLPLKLEGMNSLVGLEEGMEATDSAEARAAYEAGYRKTFTADADKRDYAGAATDLTRAIELDPDYAEAYRALGYAKFNMGFNVDGALQDYMKAVELKPDYGEAHYALAFMYAMGDRTKGAEHFKKAMALGVPDERDLGSRFYPN